MVLGGLAVVRGLFFSPYNDVRPPSALGAAVGTVEAAPPSPAVLEWARHTAHRIWNVAETVAGNEVGSRPAADLVRGALRDLYSPLDSWPDRHEKVDAIVDRGSTAAVLAASAELSVQPPSAQERALIHLLLNGPPARRQDRVGRRAPERTILSAGQYAVHRQFATNRYIGIGIALDFHRGERLGAVDTVFSGSPAERAGLKEGDLITAVDGVSVDTSTVDALVDRLRGERGSELTLGIRRHDRNLAVSLRRDHIFFPTVDGPYRIETNPSIIQVSFQRIGPSTLHELCRASQRAAALSPRALVLDLRNVFDAQAHDSAIVADAFLERGVITRFRDARGGERVYNPNRDCLFGGLPMVVLVNGSTYNGAELLAAALQENGRAVVVGEPTAASDYVEAAVELPEGMGHVLLRTAVIVRGSGRPWPVIPDLALVKPLRTPDHALETAVERLIEELMRRQNAVPVPLNP
jgi:C-terminal peptidase prc